MKPLLYCCCGIDVHEAKIATCIIRGLEDEPEIIHKNFGTMPEDLKGLAAYLMENDCYSIAMESTGVYWRPVYEAIEDNCAYIENLVVTNAAHMRNVPGRKGDDEDAEWIATLLRHGLLSSSFVPEHIFRNLREASRLHKKLVGEKSRYTNRITKLLEAHGFKLSLVLSDVLGVSGHNILNVLANKGSLSVQDVAECLRGRPRHSAEEIHAAVSGSLNPHEQSMLSLLLHKYDTANQDIETIKSIMLGMASPFQRALDIMCSIPGISTLSALMILAEISATPHMNFDSAAKLCSRAGLVPRNDESAGKIKSNKIMPGNPYIKSVICQVAWASVRVRGNPLRDWFWSHRSKLGPKKANIAVARKILTIIYALLRNDTFFNPFFLAEKKLK